MPFQRTSLRLLLLLVAVILSVVGCTGGGDTSLPAGTGAGTTSNSIVVKLDYVNPRGPAPKVEGQSFRIQVLTPDTFEDVIEPVEVDRTPGVASQEVLISGVPVGNWILRITALDSNGEFLGVTQVAVSVTGAEPVLVSLTSVGIANPSFESGDYGGWTIFSQAEQGGGGGDRVEGRIRMSYSDEVLPQQAEANGIVMGIVTNGTILSPGDTVFDFFKKVNETVFSVNMPISYTSTDGIYSQFLAQDGPSSYRMNQVVTVPENRNFLAWDMMYFNAAGQFVPDQQEIRLLVRDPETGAILDVAFQTVQGQNPTNVPTMTTFGADLSAFANQNILLDFTQINTLNYFDVATDHWRWLDAE